MTRRMQEVDDNQNTTNVYGGARPGNAPRRVADGPSSTRTAVAGLPANCYAKSWVLNLDGRMKKALDLQPRKDLGRI